MASASGKVLSFLVPVSLKCKLSPSTWGIFATLGVLVSRWTLYLRKVGLGRHNPAELLPIFQFAITLSRDTCASSTTIMAANTGL